MSSQPTRNPALHHTRVRDCMHAGVLACAADGSLQDVATIMASHHPVGVLPTLEVTTVYADR